MNAAKVLDDLKRRFPNEPEYHQAVEEVLSTIEEEYNKHPEFDKVNLIERLCIPDRVYQFRVTWMDDKGNIQTVFSITTRLARTKVVSVSMHL
jgi:glutamate dehydrogenase (NADP+)